MFVAAPAHGAAERCPVDHVLRSPGGAVEDARAADAIHPVARPHRNVRAVGSDHERGCVVVVDGGGWQRRRQLGQRRGVGRDVVNRRLDVAVAGAAAGDRPDDELVGLGVDDRALVLVPAPGAVVVELHHGPEHRVVAGRERDRGVARRPPCRPFRPCPHRAAAGLPARAGAAHAAGGAAGTWGAPPVPLPALPVTPPTPVPAPPLPEVAAPPVPCAPPLPPPLDGELLQAPSSSAPKPRAWRATHLIRSWVISGLLRAHQQLTQAARPSVAPHTGIVAAPAKLLFERAYQDRFRPALPTQTTCLWSPNPLTPYQSAWARKKSRSQCKDGVML